MSPDFPTEIVAVRPWLISTISGSFPAAIVSQSAICGLTGAASGKTGRFVFPGVTGVVISSCGAPERPRLWRI